MSCLCQFEEERFAGRFCVFHGELVEGGHLVHLAHEPQSRLYLRVHPVEVSQVRSAEGEEEAELAAELRQTGECGPGDYAAHAVAHKIDYGFPGVFEVSLDAEPYLIGEAESHRRDVSVGVHFVGGGAVEQCGGHHLADFPLEHLHVEGTGLESVAEEHHHVALVVGQLFSQLRLPQFRQLSQDLFVGAFFVLLGLEGAGQVDLEQSVVLVFPAAEEMLVDDLELADFLALSQFSRQLAGLLLARRGPSEDERADQSLGE